MGLISQTRSGTRSYFHADGHGSVCALTNASQAVTDTYDYDAYGGLLDQTGTTKNAYRYAGEQFVEGLDGYYLRARYYEPGKGRFLTRDEHTGISKIPRTLNRYLYVNANPVRGLDPSGEIDLTLQDVALAGALSGILTTLTIPILHGAANAPANGITLPNIPTMELPNNLGGLRPLADYLGLLFATSGEKIIDHVWNDPEHVRDFEDGLGIRTPEDAADWVDGVIGGWIDAIPHPDNGSLEDGGSAWYHPESGFVVVVRPDTIGYPGSAFIPDGRDGRTPEEYFGEVIK